MLKLSGIFSDHAVLQRGIPIPVWGWTTPFGKVVIEFDGIRVAGLANEKGRFLVRLPARGAGGPYRLRAECDGETIEFSDVLVGEVWLAGGQSNMTLAIKPVCDALAAKGTPMEPPPVFPPELRMFTVKRCATLVAADDVEGEWKLPLPENWGDMSAAGAFFAARLVSELGVPVGIVSCNWGATAAEAWMSYEALAKIPAFAESLAKYEAIISNENYKVFHKDAPETRNDVPTKAGIPNSDVTPELLLYAENHPEIQPDNQPSESRELPDFDDSSWQTAILPGSWQESMDIREPGVVWFRKTVEIPKVWQGHSLELRIGAVDKQDVAYFNGRQVGATGKGWEDIYWNTPRRYNVPAEWVDAGRAVIAVRAFSFMFDGGLIGPANEMRLSCPDVPEIPFIRLDGPWKAQQAFSYKNVPAPVLPEARPGSVSVCDEPNAGEGCPNSYHILFDSMVRPLIPYAVRGAVWYQGEANSDYPEYYQQLMTALINDWRSRWNQPRFEFFQVLLAGWCCRPARIWPMLRNAQVNAAHDTDTGFASAVDIGEPLDIHPAYKKEIGERLALVALHDAYQLPVLGYGPEAVSAMRNGNSVVVNFINAEGLNADGGIPVGFELGNAQGDFSPATPEIQGESAIFTNVPQDATQVRYAWHRYPVEANCRNAASLPITPFTKSIL